MPVRSDPKGLVGVLENPPRIRPADPNDSVFLATGILTASRSHLPSGFWDLVVPGSEEDRLDVLEFLTLMEARSFCHYSNFLVAETVDGPAAALAAYDPAAPGLLAPGHAIAVAYEDFGWSEAELAEAYHRLEPYQAGMPEQKRGVWTIEWVWTLPLLRRQGIISTLIERVLDQGRKRGYKLAQVTTFIGNIPATVAYERAGFRIAEAKRHPDFERLTGAPGLVRYERDL